MKLLVLTPTLGTSRFLPETVASVAQLAGDRRHVLVCPASAQDELAQKFPSCERMTDAGAGIYAALNRGLAAGGDWDAFTWINDDDLLLASGFGRAMDQLARQPETDAVYGRVALIDGRGARIGELPVARRADDLAALLGRGIMPLAQPGTVLRRALAERLGGFDKTYRLAGDLDFFVRALQSEARFEFAGAVVAAFRLSAGQLSKQRAEMEAETARALRPLAGGSGGAAAAVGRFRLDNAGVYFERIRRHGWRSMREIYDQTE